MERKIIKEDIGKVKELLFHVFNVNDYTTISRLGGMTNRSYHVTLSSGEEVIIRIPGEGTEELICRADEKVSTELACSLKIDAELLYFGDDGAKVSKYIKNAVTMNAALLREEKHIEDVVRIFKTLHSSNIDTNVSFEVFDMASNYESIIKKNNVALYEDYEDIKNTIMQIKDQVDFFAGNTKVPCHNDSLCENWVYGDGRMYLVDWEYAGMNDGMWDLADVSIEADYTDENDAFMLSLYFGRTPTQNEVKQFIANKLYLDYLWTLWGLTRVTYDGAFMQNYADKRYQRLKMNLKKFEQIV